MKKVCNTCGKEKAITSFGKFTTRKGVVNRLNKCNVCRHDERREKKRIYDRNRAKDPEVRQKNREAVLKYHEKHPERIVELRDLHNRRARLRTKWNKRREQLARVDCLPLVKIDTVFTRVRNFYKKKHNPPCICKTCGTKFHWTVYWKNTGSCSPECLKKRTKEIQRRAKRVSRERYGSLKNHKERAKHYGVAYERISPLTIYKRDKYTCQGCGVKVIKSKKYQPNQATIDHMVPMSLGGPHLFFNLITLCHACNSSKGVKSFDEWHGGANGCK